MPSARNLLPCGSRHPTLALLAVLALGGAEPVSEDDRNRQDDARSLADRIALLIDHPDIGARLAEQANQLVRRTFGLETQAAGMVSLYREAFETHACTQ